MKYRFYTNADALRYQNCRLPSGFGTVRYLGPGRANPYAVHPPMIITTEYKLKRPPAICYVADRMTGIKVLILYHNGLYSLGLEKDAEALDSLSASLFKRNMEFSDDGLADHNRESDRQVSDTKMLLSNDVRPVSGKNIQNSEGQQLFLYEGRQDENSYCDSTDNTNKLCEYDKTLSPVKFDGSITLDEYQKLSTLYCSHIPLPISFEKEFLEMMRLYFNHAVQEYPKVGLVSGQGCGNNPSDRTNCGTNGRTPLDISVAYQTEIPSPSIKAVGQSKHTPMPELKEVYHDFFQFKYGEHASRKLSRSSKNSSEAAYRKLVPFYGRSLDDISVVELQNLVNYTAAQGYSRSAVTDLVTLIRQLYRFAYPRELCTKEYGKYIVMPFTLEENHHQDFSDKELQVLWAHKNNPVVRMILIMCYSGFRVGEFAPENGMKTVISEDGKTGYFQGGIKTKAGKHRIVPIHSSILPLVKKVINKQGTAVYLCGKSVSRFRDDMKRVLIDINIDSAAEKNIPRQSFENDTKTADELDGEKVLPADSPPTVNIRYHTPHSCRHTFSRLCESYGVSEADRKRMLGHSFGNDITNGVYGHRSVAELSEEIEKIKV